MWVLIPKSRTWRKGFHSQTLFGAKSCWLFGCPRSLNREGSLVLAAAFTVNRYLGAFFVTILAVKYKHLIQTGNSHFSHCLGRAHMLQKQQSRLGICGMWTVFIPFPLLETMLLSPSSSFPRVPMAPFQSLPWKVVHSSPGYSWED